MCQSSPLVGETVGGPPLFAWGRRSRPVLALYILGAVILALALSGCTSGAGTQGSDAAATAQIVAGTPTPPLLLQKEWPSVPGDVLADGVPTLARKGYAFPRGVVVAGNGDVLVVNSQTNQVARFRVDGTYLGAFGADRGLRQPMGIALDGQGDIYVADYGNSRVQVFDAQGSFIRGFGEYGRGDGQLRTPQDLKVSAAGEVFVADSGNGRIQVFSRAGRYLRQMGGRQPGEKMPVYVGLALDGEGRTFALDRANRRVAVFSATGERVGAWSGGAVPLLGPAAIAVEPSTGTVWVANAGRHRIDVYDAQGAPLSSIGRDAHTAPPQRLSRPAGIAFGSGGRVLVTDQAAQRVQLYAPGPAPVATGQTLAPAVTGEVGVGGRPPFPTQPPLPTSPAVPDNDHWMADNASTLAPLTLGQVKIPGTHDSGTYGIAGATRDTPWANDSSGSVLQALPGTVYDDVDGFLDGISIPGVDDLPFYSTWWPQASGGVAQECGSVVQSVLNDAVKPIVVDWAVSTNLTTLQQLNAGIRYFDWRLQYDPTYTGPAGTSTAPNFWFVHGLYGGSVDAALADLQTFFSQPGHEREIVIIDISHTYSSLSSAGGFVDAAGKPVPSAYQLLASKLQSALQINGQSIVFQNAGATEAHPALALQTPLGTWWQNKLGNVVLVTGDGTLAQTPLTGSSSPWLSDGTPVVDGELGCALFSPWPNSDNLLTTTSTSSLPPAVPTLLAYRGASGPFENQVTSQVNRLRAAGGLWVLQCILTPQQTDLAFSLESQAYTFIVDALDGSAVIDDIVGIINDVLNVLSYVGINVSIPPDWADSVVQWLYSQAGFSLDFPYSTLVSWAQWANTQNPPAWYGAVSQASAGGVQLAPANIVMTDYMEGGWQTPSGLQPFVQAVAGLNVAPFPPPPDPVPPLNVPAGLAFRTTQLGGTREGTLYIANSGSGTVMEVWPLTAPTSTTWVPVGGGYAGTYASGLNAPIPVAFNPFDGYVYVGDNTSIYKIAQNTAIPFVPNVQAAGMAFDSSGNLYFTTSSNVVLRVPSGGGPATTLISSLTQAQAIAIDGSGDIWVADQGQVVRRFTAQGAPTGTSYTLPGGGPCLGLAFDRNQNLYACTLGYGVCKTNASGYKMLWVAPGGLSPVSLAIPGVGLAATANIFVSSQNGVIVEIDPSTGQMVHQYYP